MGCVASPGDPQAESTIAKGDYWRDLLRAKCNPYGASPPVDHTPHGTTEKRVASSPPRTTRL